MASPHPRPSAIKLLEGYRPDRINNAEPKPEPGIPDVPTTLDNIGKAKWYELSGQLSRMGILTRADGLALELLCQTYSEYRHACKVVQEKKNKPPQLVVLCTNGVQQQSAHYKIATQARASLLSQIQQFGLTPCSRSKLKATDTVIEDIDEFLT